MTRIVFRSAQTHNISGLQPLDMICIKDHRDRLDDALIVSVDYNKYLEQMYLDLRVLIGGELQHLSVNKHNIVSRERLYSANTREKFSKLKQLFSEQPRPQVGDFVINSNNNLGIVSHHEGTDKGEVFVVSATDPSYRRFVSAKELQIVKNVRLEFVKLESGYVQYYRGHSGTMEDVRGTRCKNATCSRSVCRGYDRSGA